MKPSKLLNVNEKYVPLEKKKPPEQLFDKSHDYELVYVRPSVQKNHSPEANNEQPQSQRNSEKKKKIQKGTSTDDENQVSKKRKKQAYDEEQEYEEEEQDNDEYQEQEEDGEGEGEDFYEGPERGDRSLVEDEYMTERYERTQRKKNGNYSNYDNKAEYVETSIDISSYLNNQKMPKFNQQANSNRGNVYNDDNGENMHYDDDQQQPEYYEREYELPSSQNDFGDERQQMRYAPKIRNKDNQERYEEYQDFDDQNYLHDILDRVRNLHDKMENSFSDITRDHSRSI